MFEYHRFIDNCFRSNKPIYKRIYRTHSIIKHSLAIVCYTMAKKNNKSIGKEHKITTKNSIFFLYPIHTLTFTLHGSENNTNNSKQQDSEKKFDRVLVDWLASHYIRLRFSSIQTA